VIQFSSICFTDGNRLTVVIAPEKAAIDPMIADQMCEGLSRGGATIK
jgi:hypothetical protein